MYLRTCVSAEPITDIVDVLTKPGVPGKVGNPRLWVDEDGQVAKGETDAVIFNWEAPIKQPGVFIQYYAVAWESQGTGKVGAINLTADECTLKVRARVTKISSNSFV